MKSIKYCSTLFLALILTSITSYAASLSDDRMEVAAGGGQTAGEYIDDALITTKVKAAIADDEKLSVFAINVDTQQGNVQLSGFVDSQEDINRAAEVAQKVEGVKSVKNNLILKSSQ